MTAKTVLNDEYWTAFKVKATQMNLERTVEVMSVVNISDFTNYTAMHYGNVSIMPHLEPMLPSEKATVTLMEMGSAFERIASILLAEYDPLENYFTDRDMTTDTDGSVEKTGDVVTTPRGKVINKSLGKSTSEVKDSNTVGQGTTYDNAGFDSTANDEFRNISKVINEHTVEDSSDALDPRRTETEYDNYSVTQNFDKLASTTDMTEKVSEHRSGNSGIFAKQDLIQREIRLRLTNRIIPILVRMVIDAINSGVWENDSGLL